MTNLKLPEDFETYPEARKNAFLKMKELNVGDNGLFIRKLYLHPMGTD